MTPSFSRAADLRQALLLTDITLVWMTFEGAVSLVLGRASHSLLLEAFGIDSIVELFSAGVLLWRLRVEASAWADEAVIESAERRASRLAGYTLYILAVYVVLSSAYGLFLAHRVTDTHESAWGILIGLIAKIGMPILAGFKLKVAARLSSRALRADAMEAITCGYLSIVSMVGLAATRLLGAVRVAGSVTVGRPGLAAGLLTVVARLLAGSGRVCWRIAVAGEGQSIAQRRQAGCTGRIGPGVHMVGRGEDAHLR